MIINGNNRNQEYEPSVTIMGANPFYQPSKFGETEKSLEDKIKRAKEKSIENSELFGTQPGVIVVDENFLITPRLGVEVVHVRKKPIQY